MGHMDCGSVPVSDSLEDMASEELCRYNPYTARTDVGKLVTQCALTFFLAPVKIL